MPKREDLNTILVIGSGPIVIGQACEFDYSGTQAVKALKEEGYRVVLVNSNPATIMTDQNFADQTYVEPINLEFVTRVIELEKPDAILPTIGGQTALNVTLELDEAGVLEKHNVELIGAGVEAIKKAEDRESFKEVVAKLGLNSAKSLIVHTMDEGLAAAESIGFPLILRPSRTLGGSGGAIVETEAEFRDKLEFAFACSPNNEVLVEESLVGWKEFELEIMCDSAQNSVIICSIENFDPMGLHTGDSVTVAPAQTLTDKEYQMLRDAALKLMREIGVKTGGSNVQFTVCPKTGRQIVIELNPRVSRSSALASKATGFPIAKIAAKLAVGYTLDELPNDITKKTPASFEPSIDYVVVKIPRFTFEKFAGADQTLGTQMKSVGEAMAIARSFPEALQKAYRSLEIGKSGLFDGDYDSLGSLEDLRKEYRILNPVRPLQIAHAIALGESIEKIYDETGFDPWFLEEISEIVEMEKSLKTKPLDSLDEETLLLAKQLGTSDVRLAELVGSTESEVRSKRYELGIRPAFKKVDTCAGEFASDTPYFYSSYDELPAPDVTDNRKVLILGGGPNRIGQGLEFDYCCVHAAFSMEEIGVESIMLNCNPETVSTDYDTSDRLYFEPLTLEDVLEVVHKEKPSGVIVQYGGQTPLRLSQALLAEGVPVIGTSPDAIDATEDREKFKALLEKLGLNQAQSGVATNKEEALAVASEISYPLMVRPSFVLGGRAMAILHSDKELEEYITESVSVSFDRPVLLDRFLANAIELDVDVVCDGDIVLIAGVAEHIERAGIHSGDSSFIMPTQTISDEVLAEIIKASTELAKEVGVEGLMNVQYAVCDNKDLYVIEVNPRASRSVPFMSKVTGIPWAKIGARVMAGEKLADIKDYGDILAFSDYQKAISKVPYIAIKESVFPFVKFRGVDALLGPEMRSTGEVMGLDKTVEGAFLRASQAAGTYLPDKGTVFLSLRDADKEEALPVAKELSDLGFNLIATSGTAKFLADEGVEAKVINKVREGSPHIVEALEADEIVMVINTPEGTGTFLDSSSIRSTATQQGIPLFTTINAAIYAVKAISSSISGVERPVSSLQNYNQQVSA